MKAALAGAALAVLMTTATDAEARSKKLEQSLLLNQAVGDMVECAYNFWGVSACFNNMKDYGRSKGIGEAGDALFDRAVKLNKQFNLGTRAQFGAVADSIQANWKRRVTAKGKANSCNEASALFAERADFCQMVMRDPKKHLHGIKDKLDRH